MHHPQSMALTSGPQTEPPAISMGERLNFTAQQPFGELLRLQKRKIYPKQL